MILVCMVCMAVKVDAQVSDEMKKMIKSLEGLSIEVYMDGDQLAVGYGHHIRHNSMEWVRDLVPGEEITVELAELLFEYDMIYLVGEGLISVRKDIGWDYPPNVYDVMGSLIYNIGLEGLKKSEFYRSFRKWDYERAFTELLMLKSRDKGVRARREVELRFLLRNYDPVRKAYIWTANEDNRPGPSTGQ